MNLQVQVIGVARECLGTPFQHQARVVGLGLDCAGVLVHVLRTLGIDHGDQQGYPRTPYKNMMRDILDAQTCLQKINKSELQPGDVLLMKFAREPQHIAIYCGETIIHAYSQIGRCVEHGFTDEWRRRVTDAYRVIA